MEAFKLIIAVCGLAISAELAIQVSAADAISYIGAVAEYYPVTEGIDGPTIATANANNYVTIIRSAWRYGTDIIVFPESSLTTGPASSDSNRTLYPSFSSFVPNAGEDIPCDNASTVVIEALRLISCAAKSYSMYVVVNLNEMENCTAIGTTSRPCPSDGYFFYNTNVVFNRAGGIVSRYRKFNLFGEPGINSTSTPDIATFKTDFDVTFGHFICFDILFKTPTLTLISEYNVTDILFPLHWFSELPYLTAVQTQSAWSYANNANLLAAAYNTPATGSGGSGIYIGTSGSLVTIYSETARNALLVARVPKVIDGVRTYIAPTTTYPLIYNFSDAEITSLVNISTVPQQVLKQDDLSAYTTSVLALTEGTTATSLDLCDRGFCCSFYINKTFSGSAIASNVSYYKYRFVVFNGVRDHSGVATTGVQLCSVISCTTDASASCGIRFDSTDTVVYPTVFHNILISGNFTISSDTLQIPDSLTTDILPLNASDFTYTKMNYAGTSVANITYNLITESRNLLTFAIYGRNFSADGMAKTRANIKSSALPLSRLSLATTMLLATIVALLVLIK